MAEQPEQSLRTLLNFRWRCLTVSMAVGECSAAVNQAQSSDTQRSRGAASKRLASPKSMFHRRDWWQGDVFYHNWQPIDSTHTPGSSIFIWTLGQIKETKEHAAGRSKRRIIAGTFNLRPFFFAFKLIGQFNRNKVKGQGLADLPA